MRIEGGYRPAGPSRAGARSTAGAPRFSVAGDEAARSAAEPASIGETPTLASLLALQAVEDPLLRRRKALRRGGALLDTLEDIRLDLLAGRVGEGRLNRLLALVTSARERCESRNGAADAQIDALLDDIELRARVELAKHGHFPAA
jgi:hypothetical protein